MKINVACLHKKPAVIHTKEFKLLQMPVPLTLSVVKMDAMLAYKCRDAAEVERQKYLVEQRPFPPYGDGAEELEITESVIQAIAPMIVAQVGPDAYTFEELVWIAATEPEAWLAVQQWYDGLCLTSEDHALGESGGTPTPSA
jgi:hypothetical protein